MSKCDWKVIPTGGYQCCVCGMFSWVELEQNCSGPPRTLEKKPCNCGDTRKIKAENIERYKTMTEEQREQKRREFRHRQRKRLQERLKNL